MKKSYKPVAAIFAMSALMSLALNWALWKGISVPYALYWFVSISMCLLAVQKLGDIKIFAAAFLTYDLLAKRFPRYAYIYPFAEALAGILMLSGSLKIISIPVSLFIGIIGAVSVIKAVYIDKRDLNCACAGGDKNVPLGSISLIENLMMVGMAVWMIFA